jgi:hypothetical protein
MSAGLIFFSGSFHPGLVTQVVSAGTALAMITDGPGQAIPARERIRLKEKSAPVTDLDAHSPIKTLSFSCLRAENPVML